MAYCVPSDAITAFNARAQAEDWPVRCDRDCVFESSMLAGVHELWRAKAQGGAVPTRDAFDLRSLRSAARNVSIVERVSEDNAQRYRFRLVGSALAQIFGEITGRGLDEVIPPWLLTSWLAGYDLVLACAIPVRFQGWLRIPGADMLKAESFCAPMRGAGPEANMILGASSFAMKDGMLPKFH